MSTEGIYQVKYTATDTKGISSTVYRNVYVSNNKYANGTAIYFNPNSNSVCSKAEATSNTSKSNGCMKWYTFNDDGSSTVNLLLDHNTTATVAWASTGTNANGPVEVKKQLENDIASWNGAVKSTARLIEASEIAKITGYPNWNNNRYYFHTNSNTQYKGAAGTNKYAWLFDNTYNCTTHGCHVADSSARAYSTNTAASGSFNTAFTVYYIGILSHDNSVANASGPGVRPVITVSRDKLR